MEIRHRKQFLTGKMVAQVKYFRDAGFKEADGTDAETIEAWISRARMLYDESETLRSQLSEALSKLREYREAEERRKDAVKEFQDEWNELKGPLQFMSEKFKKVQEREESGASDREFREEIERWIADRLSDPYSSISQALAKNFAMPLHVEANLKQGAASGQLRGDELRMVTEAIAVPHHGPGLSEAEDAMRDGRVTIQYRGEKKQVSIEEAIRLQQERDLHSLPAVKHSHYKKDVSGLNMIDIYRVLSLFEVESHAVGHAIKKLILAGKRGAKDYGQDIQEAIDSLNRELQMIAEDK